MFNLLWKKAHALISWGIRYEEYLELICMCLLDDMYNKLTHMEISYG